MATGGNPSWRINNPGMIHSRAQAAILNRPIGSCDGFAIFSEPEQGLKALADWLKSKTCQKNTLNWIAKHYRPQNPENFLKYMVEFAKVSPTQKINTLTTQEIEKLQFSICKLSGYVRVGNENLIVLPKITAKLENGTGKEDSYLISNNMVLTKKEAIDWVLTHRLDAVLVHEKNEKFHLRSRPHHIMEHIQFDKGVLLPEMGAIDVLSRSVGEKKSGQCIWAFINGVSNSKTNALESAERISKAAGGEMVFSMPNDAFLGNVGNVIAALAQKASFDTPIIYLATKFFRYLLKLSEDDPKHPPIIIFAHSQGAIIAEHALEHLEPETRKKLRIFTFGGGSFIPPNKAHPDSYNYASAKDLIPSLGAYHPKDIYQFSYYWKKGQTPQEIIQLLVMRDAMLDSDLGNSSKPKRWLEHRERYYEELFELIKNVTLLEPGYWIEHAFENSCYQEVVKSIIKKYQAMQNERRELL